MNQTDRVHAIKVLCSVLNQLMIIDNGNPEIHVYLYYTKQVTDTYPALEDVYFRLAMTRKHGYISMRQAKEQLLRLIRAYTLGLKPRYPRVIKLRGVTAP